MASDAKSTVAEAVRQGCRQLDGYLEEIVAQARSEIHEMVAEMVRYQTLLVPPVSAVPVPVPVPLSIAPDNEDQIRQHCDQALEDLEPRVKARIEKVLLEEIQRAQQLLRDERDEILETLQNLSQVSMTSSRHR